MYANRLLIRIEDQGGEFPLTPRQGTYVISAVNLISATSAILFVSLVGRRTIFIAGQFFMGVFLFLCGLSVLYEWNLEAFIFINLFITSF